MCTKTNMFRFRERMEEEHFTYHTSFINEGITFMGKDKYGYYRMQRKFKDSDQDDKSVHYFASLNKMKKYCDNWYGEGFFDSVERQYEQEERTFEEIDFSEYEEYEE